MSPNAYAVDSSTTRSSSTIKHWPAKALSSIASSITQRKTLIVELLQHDTDATTRFSKFQLDMQQALHSELSESQAIELLSQISVLKPLFDSLLPPSDITPKEPFWHSLHAVIQHLFACTTTEEPNQAIADLLDYYYLHSSTVIDSTHRQSVIMELCNQIISATSPQLKEQLGIVYTPVEVVDFVVRSVEDVLYKHFDASINDPHIKIIDPFTGTGIFIARLLQCGIIRSENIQRKYMKDIFAFEIVPLACLISRINLGLVYAEHQGNINYTPLPGLQLADTFALGEVAYTVKQPQQSKLITVIMSNPPYSAGRHVPRGKYPHLETAIESNYVQQSTAKLKSSLYDSYIKAFRLATDSIGANGIVAFVSNGAWLDNNAFDGFRRRIEQEYAAVYVLNLRGNQRTSGERSRQEGGKIFGDGSRAQVCVTVLVKQPHTGKAIIRYHDIGDYLSRKEKLQLVNSFKSIVDMPMTTIHPNSHGDWINQRSIQFDKFIPLAPPQSNHSETSFFIDSVVGISTGHDDLFYSFDNNTLQSIITDSSRAKSSMFTQKANTPRIISCLYRPFCPQWLLYDRQLLNRPGRWDLLFPSESAHNLIICISAAGSKKEPSVLISDRPVDKHLLGDTICLPLYIYYMGHNHLPSSSVRHDAISDSILAQFQELYGQSITKDDIFFYVYGLLHSRDYISCFRNDLHRVPARLPLLPNHNDFISFVSAGRKLAKLHLSFHSPELFNALYASSSSSTKKQAPKNLRTLREHNVVHFGSELEDLLIPARTLEYQLGGKSAIEWVVERYEIDGTFSASDVRAYLQHVVDISLCTLQIIDNLPSLQLN